MNYRWYTMFEILKVDKVTEVHKTYVKLRRINVGKSLDLTSSLYSLNCSLNTCCPKWFFISYLLNFVYFNVWERLEIYEFIKAIMYNETIILKYS